MAWDVILKGAVAASLIGLWLWLLTRSGRGG